MNPPIKHAIHIITSGDDFRDAKGRGVSQQLVSCRYNSSPAAGNANDNKIVLKILTFYDYLQNNIIKVYEWHFLSA